jgi:hypothetical protein
MTSTSLLQLVDILQQVAICSKSVAFLAMYTARNATDLLQVADFTGLLLCCKLSTSCSRLVDVINLQQA